MKLCILALIALLPSTSLGEDKPLVVALAQVLAHPHVFSGKLLSFDAYLASDFESSVLYPSKHFEREHKGVWFDNSSLVERLAKTKIDLTSGWVHVVGRFECIEKDPIDKTGIMYAQEGFGQLGMWQMRMTNVSSYVRLAPPKER